MAAEGLRSERWIHESFPLKELTDYWSTRPKYEEIGYSETSVTGFSASGSASGSTDEGGQSYQEWLAAQNDDKDEPPPPPYTLTTEEGVAPTTSHTEQPVQQTTTTASGAPTLAQPSPAPIHVASSQPPTVGASAASPSQFSNPINSHAQQQRPQQVVEPVAALANDFALASVSGSGLPQSVASQVVGGKVAPVALSSSHPASNNPTAYGRPTSQQSYSSGTDSIVSQTKTSGPWSTAQWPPKEWGINSGSAPATGGANLGRLQTFSASSSNLPGANLRPSATISGGPATPVHKPPQRPNTASGGSPAPLTQTGTGGYRPSQIGITMPEHSPAGFPDRPPPSPVSPHGGFGSSNYPSRPSPSSYSPGRPNFPEIPTSSFGPPYSGPSTYAWSGASGGPPNPPTGPVPFPNQASYLYNSPQQQYKPVGSSAMPPFHNPSGSGSPFDNRIPLAPTMDMSAQYPPPGPASSAYHGQDIPQGGTPGYLGHPGGTAYPQPAIPMPMAPSPMPLPPRKF